MTAKWSGLVVVLAAVMVWMVATGDNQAQVSSSAGPARVGVVDLVEVFNEYKQTQVLTDKKKDLLRELSMERDAKLKRLEQERMALQALNPNMPAYNTKKNEVRRMAVEAKIWEMVSQDDLDSDHRRWVKITYESIINEVEKVARKRGYDMVVTEDQVETDVDDTKLLIQQMINRKVVYSNSAYDITNEVLTNLNNAFERAGGAASIQFSR